jgi:hypothetical protein
MAAHDQEREIGALVLLAALVAVACIAGIPLLVDAVAQSVAQSKARAADAAISCRVCGVVEDVRKVKLGNLDYGVTAVSVEGLTMVLTLLGDKLSARPANIYEVVVRLDDGSTRVLRQVTPPGWKPGDRVKVVMGRVGPVS